MNRVKLLFTVLLAMCLILATQRGYFIKSEKVSDIYSDIIFTRLAVEAQQYTRQIEYGLKNGKSLNNFYNIQSILGNVKRCYSYINGAYIISSDFRILYSLADTDDIPFTEVMVPSADSDVIYAVQNDALDNRYILSVPIYGNRDEVYGYMVMTVQHAAVQNTVSEYDRENLIQTTIVSTLSFLGCVILIIHLCKKKEKVYLRCCSIIGFGVSGTVLLDGAISVFKLQVLIESIIQQSVSKISMSLQNDLNTVHEKGVVLSKIFDLNSWLLENCNHIPFIENLIFDKNYKITAIISDDYINNQIINYAAAILATVAVCVAAGVLLILVVVFADKYFGKGERKKITDDNSKQAKHTVQAL